MKMEQLVNTTAGKHNILEKRRENNDKLILSPLKSWPAHKENSMQIKSEIPFKGILWF